MNCLRTSIAVLFCLLSSAALVHAQSPVAPDTWMVTPSIGFALDPDADVTLAIAGGFAIPVTPVMAVEAEVGHLFDMAPGDADVDSSLTTVHGALLYFMKTEFLLTPYVAGGLGIGHFSHDVTVPPASSSQTEIGFNLGAGVTYPLDDRIGVRGDFRYFNHIDDGPSTWRFLAGLTLRLAR
jgi:hypothetical protein